MSNLATPENVATVAEVGTSKLMRRKPAGVAIRRWVSWMFWRYRYLATFAFIGFASICLEIAIVKIFTLNFGERPFLSIPGFICGMIFAFYGNYRFNFRVEAGRFWTTLGFFALISVASYSLNLLATFGLGWITWSYWPLGRFVTSGALFAIAYSLHRRFTFRHSARNLGLAVYASAETDVNEMYARVGEHIDHIHIDLVDQTVRPEAAPVSIPVIARARAVWSWQPCMIHIMSRTPRRWVEAAIEHVDTIIVHIDGDDDVMDLIAFCRVHSRSPGVVAHCTVTLAQLLPYLPHVDYVLVLGIAKPGMSGQLVMPEAIAMAHALAPLADRYGFSVIFDGGVTTENVGHLPADYIISSSTVLRAKDPTQAALALMSGVRNVRK